MPLNDGFTCGAAPLLGISGQPQRGKMQSVPPKLFVFLEEPFQKGWKGDACTGSINQQCLINTSATPRYSNNSVNNNKQSQPGCSLVLNHIAHHLAPRLFTPHPHPPVLVFRTGPDAEARLEDGRHHPRAQEGDQDHEHGAVRAHDGLAAGADGPHRADAGEAREALLGFTSLTRQLAQVETTLRGRLLHCSFSALKSKFLISYDLLACDKKGR